MCVGKRGWCFCPMDLQSVYRLVLSVACGTKIQELIKHSKWEGPIWNLPSRETCKKVACVYKQPLILWFIDLSAVLRPRRAKYDVHSARASWVSYVVFWYAFAAARGFAGDVLVYFAFDPNVILFLGSSRFPFSVPFVPIPRVNLRKVIVLASVDPAVTAEVFCCPFPVFCSPFWVSCLSIVWGFVASQGRGVRVGFEEPHLRIVF